MAEVLPNELVILAEASRALAKAHTLEEIRAVRDKAEAARDYARSASLGMEIQNFAAELKLRAERMAGSFLADLKLRGGDRRSNSRRANLKLDDLGINHSQSARWQLEAEIPEQEFEAYIQEAHTKQRELTSNGLVRLAKQCKSKPTGKRHKSKSPLGRKPTVRRGHDLISSSSTLECVAELQNHHSLLSQIFMPLLSQGDSSLKTIERHMALRLLKETDSLLRRLESEVTGAHGNRRTWG